MLLFTGCSSIILSGLIDDDVCRISREYSGESEQKLNNEGKLEGRKLKHYLVATEVSNLLIWTEKR
jgi:hypothetical protein